MDTDRDKIVPGLINQITPENGLDVVVPEVLTSEIEEAARKAAQFGTLLIMSGTYSPSEQYLQDLPSGHAASGVERRRGASIRRRARQTALIFRDAHHRDGDALQLAMRAVLEATG